MYEGLYEPLPDAGAYLRRIGLGETELSNDAAALDMLVRAHLRHVPFENIDVWGRGVCPELGIGALFDKIVARRRGGYCFELNSLFCALLRALGFRAELVAAHVMAGRTELPPPSHCALICHIGDERFFCDVGYGGDVPWGALSLSGDSRLGFRMERDGRYLKLMNLRSGREELRFRDEYIDPVELIPMNFCVSQDPGALFRNSLYLNLRLEGGSVSLVDGNFSLRLGDKSEKRQVDISGVPDIMREYFGISGPDIPMRDFGPFDR